MDQYYLNEKVHHSWSKSWGKKWGHFKVEELWDQLCMPSLEFISLDVLVPHPLNELVSNMHAGIFVFKSLWPGFSLTTNPKYTMLQIICRCVCQVQRSKQFDKNYFRSSPFSCVPNMMFIVTGGGYSINSVMYPPDQHCFTLILFLFRW